MMSLILGTRIQSRRRLFYIVFQPLHQFFGAQERFQTYILTDKMTASMRCSAQGSQELVMFLLQESTTFVMASS